MSETPGKTPGTGEHPLWGRLADATKEQVNRDGLDRVVEAIRGVMTIQDVTVDWQNYPLRVRGVLAMPAEEAFDLLRPTFEAHGFTPRLTRTDGFDTVLALPVVFRKTEGEIPWTAIILFVLTLLSVFAVGMGGELYLPLPDAISYAITGQTLSPQPADVLPTAAEFRQALLNGALYAAALLGILGAHEMGHFLMSRRHNVDVTFPMFIPLPIGILGTLGAVISMREPSPNRKVQFDIGVAGPLAGIVIAIPVMIIGLLLSEVSTAAQILQTMPPSAQETVFFWREGNSILYALLKFSVFGEFLPDGPRDVFIHPVALAGWAGFLVTALNLMPVGQLDGGHVFYGLFGKNADKARIPVIAVLVFLAVAGTMNDFGWTALPFGWSGWWLWVVIATFALRNHAPVLDEITELDRPRRIVGAITILLFVLIFTPSPLVETPISAAGETARALIGWIAGVL